MQLDDVIRLRNASLDAHRAYHEAIVAANEAGHSTRAIAEAVGVSHGTIANIIQRVRRERDT